MLFKRAAAIDQLKTGEASTDDANDFVLADFYTTKV